MISFRIDWFGLLAVQGTLQSPLQHHNSKASILQCSTFFMVQLTHPYMTNWKTIALTIQTLSAKSLLCFLICCLGLLYLSFQGASVFSFHGYSHGPQWFWSPKKENLSLLPLFPLLFAMKWWDWMLWSQFFEYLILTSFFIVLFHPHQEAL